MRIPQKYIDIFKLQNKLGKKKSFCFYSLSIFASFCLLSSLILLLIPINDTQISQNNQILQQNYYFQQDDSLQNQIKDSQLQIQTYKNNLIQMELNDKFQQQEYSNIIPIQTLHYEIKLKTNEDKICLNLKKRNEIQTKCTNDPQQLKIDLIQKNVLLPLEEMINLKMCFSIKQCIQKCTQNQNIFKKQNNACYGSFPVNEVCFVADLLEKKIIKGCFQQGKSYVKLGNVLEQKHEHSNTSQEKDIILKVFDIRDPAVKAFEYSEGMFLPYIPEISFYQIVSRYLFGIGGSLFLILSLFYAIIQNEYVVNQIKYYQGRIYPLIMR